MRYVQRLSAGSLLAFGLMTAMFGACGDETTGPEGTCEPGTNVFCRCPGGEPGTRECLDNGEDFAECVVAPETPCGERIQCEPDSAIFCLCPNGDEGTKECKRDGTGYGKCLIGPDEPCPEDSTGPGMGGNGAGGNGAGGGSTGCAHDLCESGVALVASCDPCAAEVCAADDYCCDMDWDGLCVALVDDLCDNLCNPVVMCEHSVCMTGDALTDGCDPCVTSVCAADDLCCDEIVGWDTTCVAAVKNGNDHPACAHLCCAHNECLAGAALDASCSLCAQNVCMLDSWCCTEEWDSLCVAKAQAEPSCNCP